MYDSHSQEKNESDMLLMIHAYNVFIPNPVYLMRSFYSGWKCNFFCSPFIIKAYPGDGLRKFCCLAFVVGLSLRHTCTANN